MLFNNTKRTNVMNIETEQTLLFLIDSSSQIEKYSSLTNNFSIIGSR